MPARRRERHAAISRTGKEMPFRAVSIPGQIVRTLARK